MRSRPLLLYVLIAFGWAWLCWVPTAAMDQGFSLPAPFDRISAAIANYGAWGPLLAAIVVSYSERGREGLKELVGRLLNFRIGWRWLLVALLLYPILDHRVVASRCIPG